MRVMAYFGFHWKQIASSVLDGSANERRQPMWLTFWTVTIAMALIFSVMAQVIQNDSLARGR
jgi:hypothetical protein